MWQWTKLGHWLSFLLHTVSSCSNLLRTKPGAFLKMLLDLNYQPQLQKTQYRGGALVQLGSPLSLYPTVPSAVLDLNWLPHKNLWFSISVTQSIKKKIFKNKILVCWSLYLCLRLQFIVSKLATVVEGDQKAPFSLATTPWCREGCNSYPWIAPLYP